MGIKSAASKLLMAVGATAVVGIGVNSNRVHKNAEATWSALAEGENLSDRDYLSYYGTPSPLVNDRRFGLEVAGGPIFRGPNDNSFEPWYSAKEDNAEKIALYCNQEFELVTGGSVTAEQVQKVLRESRRHGGSGLNISID